ncbi:hypothetical protein F2Q69_00027742 [Brassica cretica]|uniref:Uncharacterized protein n=1 Tax=Brassica cretica TaxID=69181 RepID=A0A8S9SBU6_BRACR|nr:hypothetical protein F2Q69_00027742 [Brassica cretica]
MQLIKDLAETSPFSLSSGSRSTLTLELNILISLSALSEEITKSILMICILKRHILRNSLHPLVKSFKFLFVNFSPEVHIRLFGVDRYLIADLSSLLSSSKLRYEIDFEFPSSGVQQDLVNVLGMAIVVVDRCASVVVDRCSHVAVDRFHCIVVDRCCPF